MWQEVQAEFRGASYTGHYSVSGLTKRQLVVYYRGKSRTDEFDPRAEQPGYVESLARSILLALIVEEAAQVEPAIEVDHE